MFYGDAVGELWSLLRSMVAEVLLVGGVGGVMVIFSEVHQGKTLF